MNKIVVTGATSMIGVATINEAIKNNVEVLAIVRTGSKKINRLPKSKLIKVLECDIDQFDSIDISQLSIKHLDEKNNWIATASRKPRNDEYTSNKVDDNQTYKTNHTNLNQNNLIATASTKPRNDGFDYEVFYHFAWGNIDKSTRNDPVLQEKNIKYTLDAVNLAKKLGCKKFVGAGSQAEYGRVEGKLTPLTPINPDIAYGMAKYAAGRLTNLRCKELGIEHIWTRILSVYGIYDNPSTMISYAINELLAGREPEFTKCEQKWDYLFSEDAGKAFFLIGEKGKVNKTYCLGSGIARPLADYVKTINKLLDKSENMGIGKKDYAPNQVMHLEADITELINDTGFKPSYTFEEGLRKTIAWAKNN